MNGRDLTALCQSLPLPASPDGVPDWVQLLPAGEIATADGRGPYRVAGDLAALAAQSLAAAQGRLPLDENHATDLAAPIGQPSPARGWIVELQARAGGLWGRIEWTEAGRALMAGKAYRYVSPVIRHLKDGTVTALLRAALTNTPNFRGMTALNSETTMDLAKLRTALGLKPDADAAAIVAAVEALKTTASAQAAIARAAGLDEGAEATAIQSAVTKLKSAADAGDTAVQAALKPIAIAAGLKDDAKPDAVEAAVKTLASQGDGKTVAALQSELTTVAGELKTLQDGTARDKATAAIDAAIAAGKPGIKPLRDYYITRHMADPAAVDKELAAMPSLAGRIDLPADPPKDGTIALNAAQREACRLTGVSEEAMLKTLKDEAAAATAH